MRAKTYIIFFNNHINSIHIWSILNNVDLTKEIDSLGSKEIKNKKVFFFQIKRKVSEECVSFYLSGNSVGYISQLYIAC